MTRQKLLCCCLPVLVIMASLTLMAQVPQPFSADLKFSSPKGASGTGKLFFAVDKVRMEMNSMGHQSIVISDMTKKMAYVVMPEQKMYMQMSTEGKGPHRGPDWRAYDATNPCANIPNTTCKKVGTETMNGRVCTKWDFVGSDGKNERTVWIDQKTGIPIKTVSEDGTVFELTNIQQGSQSASLFEVPAGYNKLDMGGMMKGMGKMQPED